MKTASLLVVGLTGLVGLLSLRDRHDQQRLLRFAEAHAQEPVAVLGYWRSFQAWHPTRNWFGPLSSEEEELHLARLERSVQEFRRWQALAHLRRLAKDPDAPAADAWTEYLRARQSAHEDADSSAWQNVREQLWSRFQADLEQRATLAFDRLSTADTDPEHVLAAYDRYLESFDRSRLADEVRRRRTACLLRIEDLDLEPARILSGSRPLDFPARRAAYQKYLDLHPAGTFVAEANAALLRIEGEWDRHDFRLLRDCYETNPAAIADLVNRSRQYLNVHPRGNFVAAATELLRWTEHVTTANEYRVVLRSGQVDRRVARFFSLGPDLSVELEVAGAKHGPSTIVRNRYDPQWEFEFARRIRWKIGDPVRIVVTDHDYWDRVVIDIVSEENDLLAIRLLSGDTWSDGNCLTFQSDFVMPKMPRIE